MNSSASIDTVHSSDDQTTSISDLLERRLIFISGKGGVGKTTVSASLAMAGVRRGKRVLLCEVNATSAFGAIFGRPVDFVPARLQTGLWAANCDRTKSLVDFLTRFVKVRRVARALVTNKVAQRFFDAAPGVLETVALERIDRLGTGGIKGVPKFDLIVVDMPSTGHAVSFLDVPRSMSKLVKMGALSDHLGDLANRLSRPGYAELLLVTHPEEMPIRETIELWHTAKQRLTVGLGGVFINRRRADFVSGAGAEVILDRPSAAFDADPRLRAARLAAVWRRREETLEAEIREALPTVFFELPWLTEPTSERELVEQLAGHMVRS